MAMNLFKRNDSHLLVTGPVQSGKTYVMQAIVAHVNNPSQFVVIAPDPWIARQWLHHGQGRIEVMIDAEERKESPRFIIMDDIQRITGPQFRKSIEIWPRARILATSDPFGVGPMSGKSCLFTGDVHNVILPSMHVELRSNHGGYDVTMWNKLCELREGTLDPDFWSAVELNSPSTRQLTKCVHVYTSLEDEKAHLQNEMSLLNTTLKRFDSESQPVYRVGMIVRGNLDRRGVITSIQKEKRTIEITYPSGETELYIVTPYHEPPVDWATNIRAKRRPSKWIIAHTSGCRTHAELYSMMSHCTNSSSLFVSQGDDNSSWVTSPTDSTKSFVSYLRTGKDSEPLPMVDITREPEAHKVSRKRKRIEKENAARPELPEYENDD